MLVDRFFVAIMNNIEDTIELKKVLSFFVNII